MRKRLISWCDDNHEPIYWLETDYIGCDIETVIQNVMNITRVEETTEIYKLIHIDIYPDDFCGSEEQQDDLFYYFQTIPTLDAEDIKLIELAKLYDEKHWNDFYNKNYTNIKRRIRKYIG